MKIIIISLSFYEDIRFFYLIVVIPNFVAWLNRHQFVVQLIEMLDEAIENFHLLNYH
jgi:hypothetical protein